MNLEAPVLDDSVRCRMAGICEGLDACGRGVSHGLVTTDYLLCCPLCIHMFAPWNLSSAACFVSVVFSYTRHPGVCDLSHVCCELFRVRQACFAVCFMSWTVQALLHGTNIKADSRVVHYKYVTRSCVDHSACKTLNRLLNIN